MTPDAARPATPSRLARNVSGDGKKRESMGQSRNQLRLAESDHPKRESVVRGLPTSDAVQRAREKLRGFESVRLTVVVSNILVYVVGPAVAQ